MLSINITQYLYNYIVTNKVQPVYILHFEV